MRFAILGLVAVFSGFVLWNPVTAVTTASVADLSLAASPYAHTSRANTGTLVLTVSSDNLNGWNVSVTISEFSYTGDFGGSAIPASNFSITTANEPSLTSGQAIDPIGGPRTTGASGTLDVSRKVLQADAGFGQGSYNQGLQVSLTIPGGAKSGTYTGTLTVTTGVGP